MRSPNRFRSKKRMSRYCIRVKSRVRRFLSTFWLVVSKEKPMESVYNQRSSEKRLGFLRICGIVMQLTFTEEAPVWVIAICCLWR